MGPTAGVQLDLGSLGIDPREVEAEFTGDEELWGDTDVRFAEAPVARFRIARTGERDVHVVGTLRATLRQDCRRCLTELESPLEVGLDLLFDPEVKEDGGREGVYPLEAEAGVLDLASPFREQLLLSVPTYPLCDEECEGLCPKCGVDRNRETCDCTLEEPDPRWDALRELSAES